MPVAIPERVQIKITHTLKWEPRFANRVRHTYRETTQVVGRPAQGTAEATVVCGQCGRRHVFHIADRAQTQRRRVRRLGKPAAFSAGLALLLVLLVNGVLGGGFPVVMAGFLTGIGLFVALVCVFAFYLDEIGVRYAAPERISSSGSAVGTCLAVAEPLR